MLGSCSIASDNTIRKSCVRELGCQWCQSAGHTVNSSRRVHCSVKQRCDALTVLCHGSLFVLALVTWMDFKL